MTDYILPNLQLGNWNLHATGDNCISKDSTYLENIVAEQIEIGGTLINVFKLLGVHEQNAQVNLVSTNGSPISSGSTALSAPTNAFDNTTAYWESAQDGSNINSAFIGWNFGTVKNSYGGEKYAPSQPVRKHVTQLNIKQGALSQNRATQLRVEISIDSGLSWERIDVIKLVDNDQLQLINLKQSFPAQMIRFIPIQFNGTSGDHWHVETIELYDVVATNISNVEDLFLLENRDRDYQTTAIQMKATYDVTDLATEFAKFGIDIAAQYVFNVSFARLIQLIGRPLVIGDIIELPCEMQYDTNLKGVKKWLEITDTGWASSGYTPNWKPTIFRFTAEPLIANTNNRSLTSKKINSDDISDDLFMSGEIDLSLIANQSDKNIEAIAKDKVPEVGTDTSTLITHAPDTADGIPEIYDSTGIYVEDGLPPNGLPYTEGPDFPATPVDGDYHRLSYPTSTAIPTRLFKYSIVKGRWIYQETDNRRAYSTFKPSMTNILNSPTRRDG